LIETDRSKLVSKCVHMSLGDRANSRGHPGTLYQTLSQR